SIICPEKSIAFAVSQRNTGAIGFRHHCNGAPVTPQNPAPLPADAPWIVMKFGGTSVATLPRWQNIRELIASRRAEGARVLVVVSALTGITDALKQLCAEGNGDKRKAAADAIAQRHHELLGHMRLPLPEALAARLADLAALAADG